ncbi:hypothetical protein [Shimia sp. SDUM112013]|uniref:hypothetical protein n=1 Tax=Shimia sp. SDUM112013 TaxID=3136160 RepID=UPI0032F05304
MSISKACFGLSLALCLAGCGAVPKLGSGAATPDTTGAKPLPEGTVRPVARPAEGDAVTPVAVSVPKGALGVTVASLGNPSETGLWLKTPLVPAKTRGRLTYGGRSQEVTLIPIEGERSAGSRISLGAMQALGIPLTELAEVGVEAL